jgi:hypothetical protein
MSMKNIHVAHVGLPGSEVALSACALTKRYFDAHVTDLFGYGKPFLSRKPQSAIMEAVDSLTWDIQQNSYDISKDVPEDKAHGIDIGGAVQRMLVRYARLFDITVLGMREANVDHNMPLVEIDPDRVAFDSARPVMTFRTNYRGTVSDRRAAPW